MNMNPENSNPDKIFNTDKELKNKYAQMIIDNVWKRLFQEGIVNADELIGTRESIENKDFDKFWQNVKKEDVEYLINNYIRQKNEMLADFEKYNGEFNSSAGVFTSDDTSFFDEKISELTKIKDSLR